MVLAVTWVRLVPPPDEKTKTLIEAAANRAYTHFLNGEAKGKIFVSVLIRSIAHDTTGGGSLPDGRHLTMNYKTQVNVATKRHMPAHVYLVPPATYTVSRVVWFKEKPDPKPRSFSAGEGEEGEEGEEEDTGE